MKTPEEIKKGLECCAKGWEVCADNCAYEESHGSAPRCMFALTEDALALIQQLEAQVPKWISVEEQAEPGEDGEYVCCGYWFGSGRKQVETAVYSGEWDIVNNFVLTHWMPLPEPPKEEERKAAEWLE